MFTKRRSVLLILLMACFTVGVQAATLHGTIYEWSDFDKPLKNAIVELYVNSTRVQINISTSGTYSFDKLSPGNYTIRAKYYRNNILEYTGDANILINKADESAEFNIDLLLFPPTDSEYEYLGDINLTKDMDIKKETSLNDYVIIILISVSFVLIILYWFNKKTTPNKLIAVEPASQPMGAVSEKHIGLPEDLRDVYELIQKRGGRITQKELRKELKYSEAKVSLMLDDLEDRGLVKKIKKGRANIIIAGDKK